MPSKNKLLKIKEKLEKKELEDNQKAEDDYWNQGTNKKKEKKEKQNQEKQLEKIENQKQKKELMQQEDNLISEIKVQKKNKKKNKNDDLYLLNQALKNAPKSKIQKEAEKKELEKNLKQNYLSSQVQKNDEANEKFIKDAISKNININNNDLFIPINNHLNYDESASNIDDALTLFDSDNSNKINYNDFCKEQLEILKQSHPGLRLSQYNEKINLLWKKLNLNLNLNRK